VGEVLNWKSIGVSGREAAKFIEYSGESARGAINTFTYKIEKRIISFLILNGWC
jgi:hypothetical protein